MQRSAAVRYLGLAGSLLLAVASYGGGARSPWHPTMTPTTIMRGENGVLVPVAWVLGALLLIGAWWAGRRSVPSARWAYVTATLWALPMLPFLPLGSYDVYSYACQGWQQAAGLDPYAGGVDLLGCPWRDAVAPTWHSSPAPYGPVFLVLAGAAAKLGGSLAGTVAGLRVIALLGVVLLGVSLPPLARRRGVPLGRAVWLALACPLVPIHLISGAHNDAVMVGFLVAGLALATKRRLLLAGLLFGLAVGVKATAIVAVPFAVLVAVQQPAAIGRKGLGRFFARGAGESAPGKGVLADSECASAPGKGVLADSECASAPGKGVLADSECASTPGKGAPPGVEGADRRNGVAAGVDGVAERAEGVASGVDGGAVRLDGASDRLQGVSGGVDGGSGRVGGVSGRGLWTGVRKRQARVVDSAPPSTGWGWIGTRATNATKITAQNGKNPHDAGAILRPTGEVLVGLVGVLGVLSLLSGRGLGWINGLIGSSVSVQWTAPATAIGMTIKLMGVDAVPVTRMIGIGALVVVLARLWWRARRADPLLYAGLAVAVTVVLAPVFHPWYGTWPLAVLAPIVRRETRWLVVPPAVASALCLPDGYNMALATKAQGAVVMTTFVAFLAVKAVSRRRGRARVAGLP